MIVVFHNLGMRYDCHANVMFQEMAPNKTMTARVFHGFDFYYYNDPSTYQINCYHSTIFLLNRHCLFLVLFPIDSHIRLRFLVGDNGLNLHDSSIVFDFYLNLNDVNMARKMSMILVQMILNFCTR